ncbi:hypothetical protein ACVWW2_008531 [Bradyrhizobium sp. LM4.3]
MLALADLVDLVLDEFAGLRACRFAGTLVLSGFADDFLSWHRFSSLWISQGCLTATRKMDD